MLRRFPVVAFAALAALAPPAQAQSTWFEVLEVANGNGPHTSFSFPSPSPTPGFARGATGAVTGPAPGSSPGMVVQNGPASRPTVQLPATFRVAAGQPFYIWVHVAADHPGVNLSVCTVTLRLGESGFRYVRRVEATRTSATPGLPLNPLGSEPAAFGKYYLLGNLTLPDGLRPAAPAGAPTSIWCEGYSPPDVVLTFTP